MGQRSSIPFSHSYWSHIHFIGHCLHSKVVPKGFRSNFHASSFSHSNQYRDQIQCAHNFFFRARWYYENHNPSFVPKTWRTPQKNSTLPLYICTKLRHKNSTNLSVLKIIATHRLKASKRQFAFQKIYHFPIQKNQFLVRAKILFPFRKNRRIFSQERR